ncbi:MAG: YvgZ [Candidatus Levybacteria bacterium GW2011_GWB1_35_5]|uniref:Transcriptional regulator n=3 Tax=Katanobacteria TaxID=422282 RepID=A0A1F4XE14_UNCKA|nr:MAG: YvgZ [Candidatus Levybacteria bacterium GW2011_GWB1_35_5]OGC79871.1 MAG: hypothetical protein A3K01_04055 [candidate division WWE3 bacterium RIFOXYD1_FULL_43_17]
MGDYMNGHDDRKKQNIHRIKIIKGHLNAIEEMINNDAYCVDVLNQSLAVQKALKGLDLQLMEGHLNHCVIEQAKKGDTKKVVEELLGIYKYKM